MGIHNSVFADRIDGTKLCLTVFRLNGRVGLSTNEEPAWLSANDAYKLADLLMEQADELLPSDRGRKR